MTMTLSRAVEIGAEIVRQRVRVSDGHASSALISRVARKVLKDDGVSSPSRELVRPLVEAIRDRLAE